MGMWGLGIPCQWWQIEPDARIADTTKGMWIDEQLQPFKLVVSGVSGWKRFMPGTPAWAQGSSAHPPTASPTR
jgi:hypothetical protein